MFFTSIQTKMKLGPKILTGFLLVTSFTLVTGIVSYVGMSGITARMDEFARGMIPRARCLLILRETQTAVAVAESGLLNDRMMSPDMRNAQYRVINDAWERANDAWKTYEPLPRTT
jgi:methyl-accepting chemotaxis protein